MPERLERRDAAQCGGSTASPVEPHANRESSGLPFLLGSAAESPSVSSIHSSHKTKSASSLPRAISRDTTPPQQQQPQLGAVMSVGSTRSVSADWCFLEMTCDHLCVRLMQVVFLDKDGVQQSMVKMGQDVTVSLPSSARNVEVSFVVVGGGKVCKVDREHPKKPWIRDEQGSRVPETFFYARLPEHVQFFVRGTPLHSWVAEVDERQKTEHLFEMLSRDFLCVRTLKVAYTDEQNVRKSWSGSGYNVKFHIPASASDVEVTLSVVGGLDVCRVDRRHPDLPWVFDANGKSAVEKFTYKVPPPCAQFEVCGPSLGAYVSRVIVPQEELVSLTPVPQVGDAPNLFKSKLHEVPAVGGLVHLEQEFSEHLLPQEVVLFEPSEHELFHVTATGEHDVRQIFCNTPLTEKENAALRDFRAALVKKGHCDASGELPRFMAPHALRMLQTCKFHVNKAVATVDVAARERVSRLPLTEAEVLPFLKRGFIYWHGRDRNCRPCLVLRLERITAVAGDKEAAVRMVIFTLEFALRFLMVPGRVENWVVIIDLANVLNVISGWQVHSYLSTATALGKTLEQVYCGRMVWIKIVNMPGGDFLKKAINGVIPAEKRNKVSFPCDVAGELKKHFEPHQLEARYGGTAPDLEASETYPFKFFPNCRGEAAAGVAAASSSAEAKVEQSEPERLSLHEATDLEFHEGYLWDDSSEYQRSLWLSKARASSLTPLAAKTLSSMEPDAPPARPCRSLEEWYSIVQPQQGEASVLARSGSSTMTSNNNETMDMLGPRSRIQSNEDVTINKKMDLRTCTAETADTENPTTHSEISSDTQSVHI